MSRPTVSIALCTFNGELFIREQLTSLARQTRPPDEIMVGDDGSSDATCEIVEAVAREFSLSCDLVRNPVRLGYSANFDQTASRCSGDFVFFCDQDDVWWPEKIERHLAEFERAPDTLMVASDSANTDAHLVPTGTSHLRNQRFNRGHARRLARDPFRVHVGLRAVPGHAISVRREVVATALPTPEHWSYDTWIALWASACGPVVVLCEPLTWHRKHNRQTSGSPTFDLRRLALAPATPSGHEFDGELGRFRNARARILERVDTVREAPSKLRLIDEKICFLEARNAMRARPSRRFASILRQLLAGRYFRVGTGWLALARDLLGR